MIVGSNKKKMPRMPLEKLCLYNKSNTWSNNVSIRKKYSSSALKKLTAAVAKQEKYVAGRTHEY